MAPRMNPFRMVRWEMMAAGLAAPSSGVKYRLMITWNCIMFFLASAPITNNTIGLAYFNGEDLALAIENVAFLMTSLTLFSRFFIMTFRKKHLYSHLARMENLMEEIEKVKGSNTFLHVKNNANVALVGYILLMVLSCFPTYAAAYYKFYFEGVDDAIPFGVFTPFDRKNHIHKTVWYQVFLFFGIVYCAVMTNTLIITISLVTSGIIAEISDQYESLKLSKNLSALKQTIMWHTEIIKIVEETNSLFGLAFVIDYILSSIYISISGFLLVKVGLAKGSSLPKYIICYIAFLINPSLFCYGGYMISTENERLVTSIYCNDWYKASAKGMKNLVLPTMMAQKRLCWNYKQFFYFDMGTYYQVVRQSYSFITMLRLMESTS